MAEKPINLLLNVSREDLANLVGTATETVNRTLSDFKEDKLIEGMVEISATLIMRMQQG